MADEATPQETTTENPATEAVEPAVDSTGVGADVQGTETETPAEIPAEAEKPAEKTYDEKYVKKLRDEAAAARVKGKEAAEQAAKDAADAAQKALTEQIARTLGLIKDDTPPDPADLLAQAQEREAQLAQERDSVATELRSLRIEKALNAAAEKHDGDTSILAPYLAGTGALATLDPAADDFATQVEAIVENAVTNNPKLKKAPAQVAAPRSGGDLSGGNGAPKPTGEKTIDDLRREKRERAKRELS